MVQYSLPAPPSHGSGLFSSGIVKARTPPALFGCFHVVFCCCPVPAPALMPSPAAWADPPPPLTPQRTVAPPRGSSAAYTHILWFLASPHLYPFFAISIGFLHWAVRAYAVRPRSCLRSFLSGNQSFPVPVKKNLLESMAPPTSVKCPHVLGIAFARSTRRATSCSFFAEGRKRS